MTTKKRGLKRGLDVLLAGMDSASLESLSAGEASVYASINELPITEIKPGRYQPRREMEPQALEDLAASIKAQGVIQPIVIRPTDEGGYEIIAGERRWRAAQMAGLTQMPVVIRHVPDEAAIAMALIENIQRENLNPVEEAVALQRLQQEFELSQQQVADAVGKSRSTITNLLRLLKLSTEVRTLLERGDIEMGHARALLPLAEEAQIAAGRQVVEKRLSVRETESLARRIQNPVEPKAKPLFNELDKAVAERLAARLSTKVSVKSDAKGQGKITISYADDRQLEAIISQLNLH